MNGFCSTVIVETSPSIHPSLCVSGLLLWLGWVVSLIEKIPPFFPLPTPKQHRKEGLAEGELQTINTPEPKQDEDETKRRENATTSTPTYRPLPHPLSPRPRSSRRVRNTPRPRRSRRRVPVLTILTAKTPTQSPPAAPLGAAAVGTDGEWGAARGSVACFCCW